jgi:hypothetical protein
VLRLQAESNLERVEADFCSNHRERLTHYCYEDNQPLCVVCAHYENHDGHKVRQLKEILAEQAEVTKETR